MTRVVLGMAIALVVATLPAWASTEPTITSARDAHGATVTLRAGDLMVRQTLTQSMVRIEITQGDDVLRFSGDLDGQVSITRGDLQRAFSLRTATAEDRAALNDILSSSRAMAAFDVVMQSSWARTTPSARVFTSTREAIRALQGNTPDIDEMLASTLPDASAPTIVLAMQRLSPSQCWDTYAQDVTKFTYDLQSCLSSVSANWWNPLHTAWCSYEYNLKSSLSAVWLLDCYGVPI